MSKETVEQNEASVDPIAKTPKTAKAEPKEAAPATPSSAILDAIALMKAMKEMEKLEEAKSAEDAARAHAEALTRTKEALAAQPKRAIRLPKEPYKNSPQQIPVCVNGYIYVVRRGMDVEVPQTVYDILIGGGHI